MLQSDRSQFFLQRSPELHIFVDRLMLSQRTLVDESFEDFSGNDSFKLLKKQVVNISCNDKVEVQCADGSNFAAEHVNVTMRFHLEFSNRITQQCSHPNCRRKRER